MKEATKFLSPHLSYFFPYRQLLIVRLEVISIKDNRSTFFCHSPFGSITPQWCAPSEAVYPLKSVLAFCTNRYKVVREDQDSQLELAIQDKTSLNPIQFTDGSKLTRRTRVGALAQALKIAVTEKFEIFITDYPKKRF